LGVTIPEHFAAICQQFPDNEAVVSLPQQRRLSYGELSAAVDELARGLLGLGFGKGERIGIWSTNNIEWLLVQLATARIGVVLVNINPAYRPRELAYALQRSEVQGLFVIPRFRKSHYTDRRNTGQQGVSAAAQDCGVRSRRAYEDDKSRARVYQLAGSHGCRAGYR
jgi:fatty-acyl-CoA synthase